MERVLLSVIMPVYNMQDTLRESLESVLTQTLKDIEIICINDGSTDGSAAILTEFSDRDARVKVINQSNRGPGPARNAGLDAAIGMYACFLDSDDYYPYNDTLELLYNTAITNNVNICGGSFTELKDGKLETKWQGVKSKYTFEYDGLTFYKQYQFDYGYQRFIYDRGFLNSKNIRFPDYRRFQDPPFFVKAMIAADKFYALKRPSYVYRVGGFKRVIWTKEKLLHMASGLTDLLIISSAHRLADLHSQTVIRTITTFLSLLTDDTDTESLKEKLKEFVLSIDKNMIESTLFSSPGFHKLLSITGVNLSDFEKQEPAKCSDEVLITTDDLRNTRKAEICSYKENEPLVSVIIPVYNVEKYISNCLSTVVDQTYNNIEILCIDDGSEDHSANIAEEYQKIDKRMKILHKANGGLSSARNYGIKHATGKYILLLDSDDYLEQNAVSKLVDYAETSGADVVHFNARAIFESGNLLKKFNNYSTYYARKKSYSGIYQNGELFSTMMRDGEFKPSAWLNFLRLEFIKDKDLFFYDGIIHEDNLFSAKALVSSKVSMYIDDIFYVRRIRENSIMTKEKSVDNISGYFICAVELAKFKDSVDLTTEVREHLNVFIHTRIKLSFDLYNVLERKGLKLSEVMSVLKYPEYGRIFELLALDRSCLNTLLSKPFQKTQGKVNLKFDYGVASENNTTEFRNIGPPHKREVGFVVNKPDGTKSYKILIRHDGDKDWITPGIFAAEKKKINAEIEELRGQIKDLKEKMGELAGSTG